MNLHEAKAAAIELATVEKHAYDVWLNTDYGTFYVAKAVERPPRTSHIFIGTAFPAAFSGGYSSADFVLDSDI